LLQTLLEHSALQQHPAIALQAAQADVGAKARNFPVEAATRVRFTQPQQLA
jgi:hypothetical protein